MGLDVVMEGLAVLREEGLRLRAAVWGDGDGVSDLIAVRDRLTLTEVVEIPGRRFRLDAIVGQLGQAGMAIVPLRRDVFTDLMLPTKLLEYVRLGVPVAVSWTPTIADLFPEDSVFYIRELSVAGVAGALRQMLVAPVEARARAARAQMLDVARSWQEREGEFVALLEQELARARG
jgi:glycosyltransferase involved in cell wall biosynthesis